MRRGGRGQEMESRRCKPSSLRRPHPSLKDSQKSSRVLGDPSDTTRRKKVKFAEFATVLGTTSDHDFPLFQAQKSQSTNFNDPKTFEYKFFREIREKTSCNHKNLQLFMEKIDTRASQPKDVMQETNSSITSRHETGSSSGAQMIIPVANTFSISPVIPVKHESRISTKSRSSMSMPLLPILDVTLDSQTWNHEPEHENGGIFSSKRSRLLQLVAEPFSLAEDKFELSRLDLIPVLLQRLGIDKELYEGKLEEFPESVKNVSCGQIQPPPSSNSYFLDMENTAIGTELVASEAKEQLHKDHQSHTWSWDYDDELRRLPWDYSTNLLDFPNWPALENRLLQKNRSSLELVSADNSELHNYEMSPAVIEWSSNFKHSNDTSLMFTKPDHKDLNKFLHCLPTNQSLVPYAKPKLWSIFDPSSPGEKSTFQLLQWKEKAEEPEFGLASANFVFPQMDNLNVSGASRLPIEMKNRYRKDDIFNSLRSDDHEMMLHDAINGCLDIFPSKLEATFGLEWKTLPLDFATRYHLSNHMEVQLYNRDAEGKPTFLSVGCSFDDVDEDDHSNHRLLV